MGKCVIKMKRLVQCKRNVAKSDTFSIYLHIHLFSMSLPRQITHDESFFCDVFMCVRYELHTIERNWDSICMNKQQMFVVHLGGQIALKTLIRLFDLFPSYSSIFFFLSLNLTLKKGIILNL